MIALFTDFGSRDLYVGQVHAVLASLVPEERVIDLFHDAPPFDISASATLLGAMSRVLPTGSVVVGVVDPDVGGERLPIAVQQGGRWYVGPDNGLFASLATGDQAAVCYRIRSPEHSVSATFHGRDLFAPTAADIVKGEFARLSVIEDPSDTTTFGDRPETTEPDRVIYVDHYGNCITSLSGRDHALSAIVRVGGVDLRYAGRFGAVAVGEAFWYVNSIGLIEIAANQASASDMLGIRTGESVVLIG